MKKLWLLLMAGWLSGCFGGSSQLPPELQNGFSAELGGPNSADSSVGLPPASGASDPIAEPIVLAPEAASDVPLAPTGGNCEALLSDLETSFVDMNFCDTDSDCAFAQGSCPFGCYLFHNQGLDFADYQPSLTAYQTGCDPCEYKCDTPPRAADLRCQEGRCVDVRFRD